MALRHPSRSSAPIRLAGKRIMMRPLAASDFRAWSEVRGRNAGWLTLHSGVASGADIILLPEIPFSWEAIMASIEARRARGRLPTRTLLLDGPGHRAPIKEAP